jgi:2-dehydropantoate 2-reductase
VKPVDWVLVTTKAYDSESASAWFATACGPRTRVAVIQNGVEHLARFEKHFDIKRLVPVMIDLPAERLSPGKTIQRGPAVMIRCLHCGCGPHPDVICAAANSEDQSDGAACWCEAYYPVKIFFSEADAVRAMQEDLVGGSSKEEQRVSDEVAKDPVDRDSQKPDNQNKDTMERVEKQTIETKQTTPNKTSDVKPRES